MFQGSGYEEHIAQGTSEFVVTLAAYLIADASPAKRIIPEELESVLLQLCGERRSEISPMAYELQEQLISSLCRSVERSQAFFDSQTS